MREVVSMTVRDAVLVVFCGLAAFSLCYAKVGRHESINDLFTDEETFHYTDDHVKLREELKVDQDAVQKAFRFVITYNVSVIAQLILKPRIVRSIHYSGTRHNLQCGVKKRWRHKLFATLGIKM